LVILPGSKQTIDDLDWLERTGFARALREKSQGSQPFGLVGICGGMQMLGEWIDDPTGAESLGQPRRCRGLRLLSLTTVLNSEKITRRVCGQLRVGMLFGKPMETTAFSGYEIHLGETQTRGCRILAEIEREGVEGVFPDGAVDDSNFVWGTYVHGLFDDDRFRHSFLRAARAAFGLEAVHEFSPVTSEREKRLDHLAAQVRSSLDVEQIARWLQHHDHANDAHKA
jgi:adenosylcobyric acid synthase